MSGQRSVTKRICIRDQISETKEGVVLKFFHRHPKMKFGLAFGEWLVLEKNFLRCCAAFQFCALRQRGHKNKQPLSHLKAKKCTHWADICRSWLITRFHAEYSSAGQEAKGSLSLSRPTSDPFCVNLLLLPFPSLPTSPYSLKSQLLSIRISFDFRTKTRTNTVSFYVSFFKLTEFSFGFFLSLNSDYN